MKPYQKISISHETFKDVFVDSFDMDSSRYSIYDNYLKYIDDFRNDVSNEFTHWIDGSFISTKTNPRDIDFVALINFDIYKSFKDIIKNKFIREFVYEKYQLDAYILVVYPENHELYNTTKLDLAYWHDWFSKSRKNRRKQRNPKGFIEVNFK